MTALALLQPFTVAETPGMNEGVCAVATFDNTLCLWSHREVIAQASPIVLVGADANRFIRRTLFEVLRFVAVGQPVFLLADLDAALTPDAVMAAVESIAPGEFQRVHQGAPQSAADALHIVRTATAPAWQTAPHTGWSILLPDGEAEELSAQVSQVLAAARRAKVTCELLVATNGKPQTLPAEVRAVQITLDSASLSARLNRLADAATHSDLLYLRRAHVPAADFFAAAERWGHAYAIATPRLVHRGGERGADWLQVIGDATYPAPAAMMDYRDHSSRVTLGGGALLLRRATWQRYRWNENLVGDDVVLEYVRRLQRAGCLPLLANAVIRVNHPAPSLPEVPFDPIYECAIAPTESPMRMSWMSDRAPWMVTDRERP